MEQKSGGLGYHPNHARYLVGYDNRKFIVDICLDKCMPYVIGELSSSGKLETISGDGYVMNYNPIDDKLAEIISQEVSKKCQVPRKQQKY